MTRIQATQALENNENVLVRGLRGAISAINTFPPSGGRTLAPFPLALDRSRSVLAVKGSLRRFAPWTAPGRSERRAAYEGKGGDRAVGREGELAHDKGYYHSCLGRSRKEPFGHTRRLSRSRGALSPVGP